MATTYTPRPGESIGDSVELLVTLAGASRGRVDCEFNGIQFWAEPGESRSLVAARYRELCEAASAAYRNSPEGIAAAKAEAERLADHQARYDQAILDLKNLNLRSDVAVLEWLERVQYAADHIGVLKRTGVILEALKGRGGFAANVNTGASFNGESRDNFFRYLVGQALDGFEHIGVPHPVLLRMIGEWRAKFLPQGKGA